MMQAVLLAAGRSSRMYPFAQSKHKSMISLLGKPLLFYTIEGLKKTGIKNIIIVVDKNSVVQDYFGSGEKFGVSLSYIVQPHPLGMGDALLLAAERIEGDFLLLHGYHVDVSSFAKTLIEKKTKAIDAVLLAQERDDTWKYGVLTIEKEKVVAVTEKPKKGTEASKLCAVGIYLLSKDFLDVLHKTPPEHYQFEKALSDFAKIKHVAFVSTNSDTVVLKYPWDLLVVKNYLLKKSKKSIGKNTSIAKSAELIGDVVISDNVTILEGAKIKGPCYLGENVYVGTNAILRNGVVVEKGAVIGAHMEVKNSVIMEGSTTHSGFIGDSVIGEHCKIAAQFGTANVRLDRTTVKVDVKGEKIDSELKSLGAMIGDKTQIGIQSSTMPGIVIGSGVLIGPATSVKSNVENDTTYYTKFQEVVSKK